MHKWYAPLNYDKFARDEKIDVCLFAVLLLNSRVIKAFEYGNGVVLLDRGSFVVLHPSSVTSLCH